MEISVIAEVATAMIAALGGWEAIKYLINRKTNARKAEADADGAEFAVLKETVEFLQIQLKEKEERFANQTDHLRKIQNDYLELLKKNAATELELQRFRCVRPKCAQREPQNGF